MKRVLIPTDFSRNAWNAIAYAMHLFQGETCTFYLLNTFTPAIPSTRFMAPMVDGGRLEDSVRRNSEDGLERTIEKIKSKFPVGQHQFQAISSFNLLVDEVNDVAETYGIDLIITGTKGASGMEEVFLGSNTVRIIKGTRKCPVLVVPHNIKFTAPSEIAFATDFSRFYTASELAPLVAMARAYKSVIRIVHVQEEIKALSELQQFNLNMLRRYLGGIEHYVHTVSELNSISRTFEIFARELGVHLLAMLNYRHSFMERMTREPIVKRTAFHTQIPLLVIPESGMAGHTRRSPGTFTNEKAPY